MCWSGFFVTVKPIHSTNLRIFTIMRTYILLFIVFAVASCAPSRFVEPLDKGEWAVGGSFGGPVIDFAGAPIPVPITSIEVGYGLDSTKTIHGGLHTTAMLFGNFQIDAGMTYQFLHQKKWIPNVSASAGFNTIYDFDDKSGKFWPTLDANAFWNYGKRRNYFYTGFNNYFDFTSTLSTGEPQTNHILFSPQIGHVLKGKNRSWELTTELKFLAPYMRNDYAFVPYKSITGNFGAAGFYIGFRKILGNKSNGIVKAGVRWL